MNTPARHRIFALTRSRDFELDVHLWPALGVGWTALLMVVFIAPPI